MIKLELKFETQNKAMGFKRWYESTGRGLFADWWCEQESGPTYAIGVRSPEGNYGMTHGPTHNLEELLETIPGPAEVESGRPIELLEFGTDGQFTVLYKFNDRTDDWMPVRMITEDDGTP